MTYIIEDDFFIQWQQLTDEWQRTSSLLQEAIADASMDNHDIAAQDRRNQSISEYNSRLVDLKEKINSLINVRNIDRNPPIDGLTVGIINAENTIDTDSTAEQSEVDEPKVANQPDGRRR